MFPTLGLSWGESDWCSEMDRRRDETPPSDRGRIDDPDPVLAAYFRSIDQMPEMTREGEIYLMKQIEEGKREVREAICRSRVMTKEVLRTWKRVEKDA